MNWTESEKEKITEWLNDNYFSNQNFGTTPKAEIDLFMFSMYLDHLIDADENFDDYIVGRDLGLTISRVRSLKERKELKYHRENYNWAEAFAEYIKNARYDETSHLVKMSIPDVNVIKDVRYCLEVNGWYDEYQLNPKLFQCRLDIFIELCKNLPNESGESTEFIITDEVRAKLLSLVKESGLDEKDNSVIERFVADAASDGLKSLVLSLSKEALGLALSALPFGGVAKTAINFLIKTIGD